ncbi:MAG TPA: hypothetical protein VHB79_34900 [Polyangiaceae bacterium]|nr:hypothetical protein [Polyangiaceae bacterium]
MPTSTVERSSPGDDTELRYDWDPQLLPTRLHLAPEFRNACAPVVALPPSIALDGKEEVVDALEPIATCLTLGPVTGERLHLFGSSTLPGQWDAPFESGGRADQLRTSLSLLGVPFDQLVTHDVERGPDVELTTAPGAS